MTAGGHGNDASLPAGQIVAQRYRIERLIGEGGFGAVYQATQQDTGAVVAFKILHQERSTSGNQQRRFQREAELAMQLRHPNVVRTLDHGHTETGLPFIVFELLVGESLQERLDQTGKLTCAETGTIAAHLLEALGEAHGLGIVHRDVKPANIFLCAGPPLGDSVRVLDFGIAKAIAGDESKATKLTQTGQMLGTPYYMAPEQVQGGGVTPATDVYATGLMMAEMLTGRPVINGTTAIEVLMSHVSDRPLVLADEVLASPLGTIIFQAIKKPPSERWASALDMSAAIRQALGSGDSLGQTVEAPLAVGPGTAAGPAVASATPYETGAQGSAHGPISDGYAPAPGAVNSGSYGAPAGYPGAGYHVPGAVASQAAPRSHAALYVLVGVLATIVVLGAVGGGVWLTYQRQEAQRAEDEEDDDRKDRKKRKQRKQRKDRDRNADDGDQAGRLPDKPPSVPDRLVGRDDPPTSRPVPAPPPPPKPAAPSYRAGQNVSVFWGKKWWPATVIRPTGPSTYLVHYDGYASSWDEVVGPSRIRSH
jgi:tRNA A-37 threonylcarbamoyl transferase component Bud32